ncbi:MAG: glycerophosphoryl diester phosphodiesterase membrane domain-containing protein [Peptococcaceae bacterium]|jgi:hypothetical protein|nr:glycerophosphoryl diester phosphodiesterase membrane domain-containing protein [Peptococcaceae bacterium]
MERLEKPLSVSKILDVSFKIIRYNFLKILFIPLILLGPLYVLQALIMLMSGAPFIHDPSTSLWFWNQLPVPGDALDFPNYSPPQLIAFVLLSLLSLVALPVAYAALMIATAQIRRSEDFTAFVTIRQAFSRYLALLGGSAVYFLISLLLFLALSLPLGIFLAVSTFVGTLAIVVCIVLGIVGLVAITYFLTRWSFFFPALVFEKVAPGIGKSWQLTHRSVWRIIGFYLIISIISLLIFGVFQTAAILLLGNSILATLIVDCSSLITTVILVVAVTIFYFDLRVRNDAADVKELLAGFTPSADSSAPVQQDVDAYDPS